MLRDDFMSEELKTIKVEMFGAYDIPSKFTGRVISRLSGRVGYYKDGYKHRLDGPAIVGKMVGGKDQYWIDGHEISEVEYWNHPLVIEYRLENILKI